VAGVRCRAVGDLTEQLVVVAISGMWCVHEELLRGSHSKVEDTWLVITHGALIASLVRARDGDEARVIQKS